MKSEAPEAAHNAPEVETEEPATALEDAIHALAQPLTALSFVLDLAWMRSDPEAWWYAVESGRTECRRAVAALQKVRAAARPGGPLVPRGMTEQMGQSR